MMSCSLPSADGCEARTADSSEGGVLGFGFAAAVFRGDGSEVAGGADNEAAVVTDGGRRGGRAKWLRRYALAWWGLVGEAVAMPLPAAAHAAAAAALL